MARNETLKSTRERVLQTLLTTQQCTINEIANAVDINPISVRHHITKLEADGMVSSAEERHGVGRPRRLYFLTETGREHFPTRYLRLSMRLLDQLKETVPQPVIDQLFVQIAEGLAADYSGDLANLTIEERLDLIKKILITEGFSVDWERKGDYYQINETNCPYIHVGYNHPEVCSVDQTLISTLLKIPTIKIGCMLSGDAKCSFTIPINSIGGNIHDITNQPTTS